MRIVVTHLTRLGGRYICVAGTDEGGELWRPVFASGRSGKPWAPHRRLLRSRGGHFRLGSEVDLGDVRYAPFPPEVEDVLVDAKQVKFVKDLDGAQLWTILDGLAKNSLSSIFGPNLESSSLKSVHMPVGAGERSLGILRLSGARLEVHEELGIPEIRLVFKDYHFAKLELKVTDLRLWEGHKPNMDRVKRIQDNLCNCLVAVDLTRAWMDGLKMERHWLQVNNIFPRSDPLWERE